MLNNKDNTGNEKKCSIQNSRKRSEKAKRKLCKDIYPF